MDGETLTNRRHYKMDRQIAIWMLIIAVVTALITVSGAWAINSYITKDDHAILMEVKEDVTVIKTKNIDRDEDISDFKTFIKADAEWKIDDGNWKGSMSTGFEHLSDIIERSLFYGSLEDLDELKKISDEIKNNIPKKKYER